MQLAARAYYRIARVSDDKAVQLEFQSVARNAVSENLDYMNLGNGAGDNENRPTQDDLKKLSSELEREMADARTFFAAIEADERRWIDEGGNVDEAFAAKYYPSLDGTIEAARKQLASEPRDERMSPAVKAVDRGVLILVVLLAGFIALVWRCVRAYRRFRAKNISG